MATLPGLDVDDPGEALQDPELKAEVEKQVQHLKDQLAADPLPLWAVEYRRRLDMAPSILRRPARDTLRSLAEKLGVPQKKNANQEVAEVLCGWLPRVAVLVAPMHSHIGKASPVRRSTG